MSEIRKAFETWYSGGGVLCKSVEREPAGGYRLMQAQQAWLAWMACADHFAAQLAAPVAHSSAPAPSGMLASQPAQAERQPCKRCGYQKGSGIFTCNCAEFLK